MMLRAVTESEWSKMQLFCFTFAGGTAAFFDVLEERCAGRLAFVKLEYPGHGARRKEPLCDTFQQVARDLCRTIKERYTGDGYALLGYSMGSITLLEVLRTILTENLLPPPRAVFLAAHVPAVEVHLDQCSEAEVDEYVRQRTISFGGVPQALLNNRSFWRMYLPLYKADYRMISRYDFAALRFTTDVPAVVFYSEADTPRTRMEAWRTFFVGDCEFIEYEGSHFFINEHCTEMAQVILDKLGVQR